MHKPELLAIIGGSGVERLEHFRPQEEDWPDTPFGRASAPVQRGTIEGRAALYLARHGVPHTIAPHRINYRANIHTLWLLGATAIIALNAVGGIAAAAAPGALWLPDQIIDYSWGREASFFDGEAAELRHLEFAEPFDAALAATVSGAAAAVATALHVGGVYGCTQGPRLETAAEIRRMQRDGCDLVGMTAMPEAALARELGLRYLSIAMVVNRAAGLEAEPISMEAIRAQAAACVAQASRVLAAVARVRSAQSAAAAPAASSPAADGSGGA